MAPELGAVLAGGRRSAVAAAFPHLPDDPAVRARRRPRSAARRCSPAPCYPSTRETLTPINTGRPLALGGAYTFGAATPRTQAPAHCDGSFCGWSTPRNRKFADSPLEGDGFELWVRGCTVVQRVIRLGTTRVMSWDYPQPSRQPGEREQDLPKLESPRPDQSQQGLDYDPQRGSHRAPYPRKVREPSRILSTASPLIPYQLDNGYHHNSSV